MSNATPTPPSSNIYQIYFDALITTGSNAFDATLLVVEKYLDGKPARRGKHKITKAERDVAFWSAGFLKDLPIALWETDLLTLALAHYLDQDRISRPELLTQVAANTPFSICKAMRYARMAYQPKPDKISELRLIGQSCPEIHEQCLILDIFSKALDERQLDLEGCKQALQDLTPFELLVYASLYAFRDIIPITFNIETGQHRDPVVYPDVGEIDLICARDNIVLVIEVKSSFMRRTEREAWLHGTNTLRKAGQQLRRKIDAMMQLLQCDTDLIDILSLKPGWAIHGLIADTSIELDHDRFSCFLKISIEELIIALRDDRQWLTDPDGILRLPSDDRKMEKLDGHTHETLYPDGFNASRFLDVLENELVWQDTLVNDPSPDTVGMGLV